MPRLYFTAVRCHSRVSCETPSPAFAEGMGMDNKSSMDKPKMESSDKMAKPDSMAKPASDKMEKPGAMMDKKDAMSSDKMKK